MAHNFNNSQGQPPSQMNGFEDLMGSLRSPSVSNPLGQGFQLPQWPLQGAWPQANAPGAFPFNMPQQPASLNQIGWNQNNQAAYNGTNQDDDEMYTVDDTDVESSGNVQMSDSQPLIPPGGLPSLASSSPLTLPKPQFGVPSLGPPSVPKPNSTTNATATARAAELRAKLLASKGSKSGSPAVKTKELSDAKKTKLMDILKQTSGGSGPQAKDETMATDPSAPAINKSNDKPTLPGPVSPTTTATSLGGAIDSLMSEARDAADAPESHDTMNGKPAKAGEVQMAEVQTQPKEGVTSKPRHVAIKSRSPSELSEPGEIRSGPTSPTDAAPKEPKAVATNGTKQVTKDKQEKLARQNEVKKAYQPLKKPKGAKSDQRNGQGKPLLQSKAPPTQPHQPKKMNTERTGDYERPSIREEPRREQFREQAKGYDRRDVDNRDLRRSSLPQAYPTSYDLERDVAARRQKLTDNNSKRAAEYKQTLDAQNILAREPATDNSRPPTAPLKQASEGVKVAQPSAPDSSRKASVVSNVNDTGNQNGIAEVAAQDPDTVMQSPHTKLTDTDEDINDWLELTEFYDEEYRERRLKLFRKKKALDIQRAEVEQEEERELQERTLRTRAQSIIPIGSGRSPSVVRRASVAGSNPRMPPPPLPLRETNPSNDGIKIKDSALSAGLPASQITSPTLKRQYAEDNTENSRLQSIDKRVRLDTSVANGFPDDRPLTSPTSAKTDRPPVKGEPLALEQRMSRYDDWNPRGRPRSRSPEYRRRSLSPRRRRYSQEYSPGVPAPAMRFRDHSTGGPRRQFGHTCYNCGQHGHVQTHCPEPRAGSRQFQQQRGYDQYVSPSYKGKNPAARPPGQLPPPGGER